MLKNIIIFLVCLGTLSGCTINDNSGESQSTTQIEEVSEGTELKLVQGPNNSTQVEAINHVKKILSENPDFGIEGSMNLNYMDSIMDAGDRVYAVFLVSNRTKESLTQSFEFTVNWVYDGTVIYENAAVLYNPDESGILLPNSGSIIFLEIPQDKVELVNSMTENSKMTLSVSNFAYVE